MYVIIKPNIVILFVFMYSALYLFVHWIIFPFTNDASKMEETKYSLHNLFIYGYTIIFFFCQNPASIKINYKGFG